MNSQQKQKRVLVLVGCGAEKQQGPAIARELYTGPLFRERRGYAERIEQEGGRWAIVSAKLGLVNPDRVVAPYDQRLDDLPLLDRLAWAPGVALQLIEQLGEELGLETEADVRSWTIEIHAGQAYAGPLAAVMAGLGFDVVRPVQGLTQGEQRSFYAERRARERGAT